MTKRTSNRLLYLAKIDTADANFITGSSIDTADANFITRELKRSRQANKMFRRCKSMSKYPNMLNMLKSPFSGLVSQTEVTRGCRFTQNGAEIPEPYLAWSK